MKQFCILISSCFILSACVDSPQAPSNTRGHYNLQAPYKWSNQTFPRVISISNQFSAAEVASITSMGDAWKAAVQDKMTFFSFGSPVSEKTSDISNMDVFLDQTLGVYKIENWPLDLPGTALAVTQLYGRRFNTGTDAEFVNIEHADILVNVDNFKFNTTDSLVPGQFDLQTVMLHEFGHFLGLPHNSGVGRSQSVMYPSITTQEVKRVPMTSDIDAMAQNYGISLGGGANGQAMAMDFQRPDYSIPEGEQGVEVKIMIELHADGECVHIENDVVVQRHSAVH